MEGFQCVRLDPCRPQQMSIISQWGLQPPEISKLQSVDVGNHNYHHPNCQWQKSRNPAAVDICWHKNAMRMLSLISDSCVLQDHQWDAIARSSRHRPCACQKQGLSEGICTSRDPIMGWNEYETFLSLTGCLTSDIHQKQLLFPACQRVVICLTLDSCLNGG